MAADLQAICEGLAANAAALKAQPDLIKQVSAYPLENPTAPAVLIAGVEADGYQFEGYSGGSVEPSVLLNLLVQVVLGEISKPVTFKRLNRLMAPWGDESLVVALEADPQLTSRYQEDGSSFTVLTGQSPAASAVAFHAYRGQSLWTAGNGVTYVSANWTFTVQA